MISEPSGTAGPCEAQEDCREGYECVTTANFTGKVCQLPFSRYQPDVSNVQAFYCTEVKTVLDTYCVSCHGATPAGGASADFRLDYYEQGTVPGAKAKADRIFLRVQANTMPPGVPLSDEIKTQLEAWVQKGAPECATPGPPM